MKVQPGPYPPASRQSVATAVAILRQRFGERLQTGEAVRNQHAATLTWIEAQPPDAVLFANSGQEVAETVRICGEHRVPIIPFGSGTSLEGHVNAPLGGISLDLSGLNKILSVNSQDLDCVVEAGVSRSRLNNHLRDMGLFFTVDPGAEDASLGGMAATRASGTTAVRYGTMRDNVINLTAVMADGAVVRTARRARKSSSGYDLTHLLVGSEGTLGIITELTLRLHGIPETILAASCPFATLEGACNATIQAIQLGLGLARIELLDALQVQAVNSYSKLDLPEKPMLFLEFHGSSAGAREQVAIFEEIARAEGAIRFDWAEKEEDRRRLWKARHDAYWSAKSLRPGAQAFSTDVCVPISRLAECVTQTQDDIRRLGLISPIVGHVGDGNFHCLPLIDPDNPAEKAATEEFLQRLVERALAMDGTCTGEHGIGQGKAKYMAAEHGTGLAVMQAIKQQLDPKGILNPGKMLWG